MLCDAKNAKKPLHVEVLRSLRMDLILGNYVLKRAEESDSALPVKASAGARVECERSAYKHPPEQSCFDSY